MRLIANRQRMRLIAHRQRTRWLPRLVDADLCREGSLDATGRIFLERHASEWTFGTRCGTLTRAS